MTKKIRSALPAAMVAALAIAAPAAAHVSVTPDEAASGGSALLEFQVGHGCDGSSTKQLRIQIPESVPSAKPVVHPGWTISTKEGPKTPTELYGEKITKGVSEITFTADGDPLPDGQVTLFGASVALPKGKAGDTVVFPVIQTCIKGETRWIEVPAAGETEEDLESPAPVVTLGEAEEGHHGGGAADEEAADTEKASDAGDHDSDDHSEHLAIAALIVAGLALLVGILAVFSGRRKS